MVKPGSRKVNHPAKPQANRSLPGDAGKAASQSADKKLRLEVAFLFGKLNL
jgi:hypothetical protein